MTSRFLQALSERVIVVDGAMGTSLHAHHLDIEHDYLGCENCTDILVASRPDVVASVHRSFLEAGADAVETDTFGANRLVLKEFDQESRSFELNKRAGEIARAVCDEFKGDRPRFVLGSMGPGTRLVTLGNTTWDEMLASYREQARGLIAGGVDAFIIETCQDLLQIKCAVVACLRALDDEGKSADDIPIMVSVTIETTGAMLLGSSIEAAANVLSRYPIASLGLNCATGPAEMGEHVQWLCAHWDRSVSVIPNAGLPVLADGQTKYPLGAAEFAGALQHYVREFGVNIVGGCCGTTPEHIRQLARAVRGLSKPARAVTLPPAGCSSLYAPQEFRQETSFLIVGERMNASGSRKFKTLLESEDFDGVVSLAREQMKDDGAHVLDLNVDYAGRDNAADMSEIVSRVARQVDAPLMLDSTQSATIEAGLKRAPGKCIINSANFEDGEEKFDAICALAKTYGAALIIGSIDEDKEASMARTAARKLSIARRAYERATRVHGLPGADLFFDPLVLPVSTGLESDRRSALETTEGVRAIARELPNCQTTVGLSNVSFGLVPRARVVLNSVFLHELLGAGLTSAIVHASKILPRNRIDDAHWAAALDLIYDRRAEVAGGTGLPMGVDDLAFDPLQRFISLFENATAGGAQARTDDERPRSIEERLRAHIIDGEKKGLSDTIDLALTSYAALDIINDHLLDGMKTVGDLFGSGRMQLPFVLQSAEVMKSAVALLEPHMEKSAGRAKGSIVLATVKGDVHDIGKNLVDIILTNNGYTVYNIGIKQPISSILAKWRETEANAIGLSGLLVKSVHVMEENIRELNAEGVRVPLVLGGAALTRHYAEGHLRSQYQGECFYGKDAFEGLRVMDAIACGRESEIAVEIAARGEKRASAEAVVARDRVTRDNEVGVAEESAERSDIEPVNEIPSPPFWGSRVAEDIGLDEIYPYINTVALFRGQWQFKKGALSDAEYDALVRGTVEPIFERVKRECRERRILTPRVVYGYFPCFSEGNDLVVLDPEDRVRELERFTFPRQRGKKRLCISDFFRSREQAEIHGPDVIAMHCVTVGSEASVAARALFESGDYAEYLYLHGLGVETAEALAEYWHKQMRRELGIAGDDSPNVRELFTQHYRGSRYSFGYPACPEMSDQEKLFRLLRPDRIGCELTENWQIDPEQSTSAIVVHHPRAKYFAI